MRFLFSTILCVAILAALTTNAHAEDPPPPTKVSISDGDEYGGQLITDLGVNPMTGLREFLWDERTWVVANLPWGQGMFEDTNGNMLADPGEQLAFGEDWPDDGDPATTDDADGDADDMRIVTIGGGPSTTAPRTN